MIDKHPETRLEMIPLEQIDVLNTRDRDKKIFEEVVKNIISIGLKKPITVTPRISMDGSRRFLLICGEERFNAFRSLGETEIPALIVDVSDDDAFIMSLAENIARRQARPLEILSAIRQLSDKGYSPREIGKKTGLDARYVTGILTLLQRGEERLLVPVERGRVPLNAALAIVEAGDDDSAIQTAMQDAYESGKLRGRQLKVVQRLIERRQTLGRSNKKRYSRNAPTISSSSLVRTYQREVERQKNTVRKAELTQHRLLFLTSALRQFFADENFVNLLRAEGLDSLPEYLAQRIWPAGNPS